MNSDRLFDSRRRERNIARGHLRPAAAAKKEAESTEGSTERCRPATARPLPRPPVSPATPAPVAEETATFEDAILPHLSAARRLARSLMRDPAAADDVVQDACVRAWRHFASFKGANGRPWLLRIVRNVAFSRLRRPRIGVEILANDEADDGLCLDFPDPGPGPEAALLANEDARLLNQALAALPSHLRHCLQLRVVDELSYKEIAEIADVPVGTVMSRLHRARRLLMAPRPDQASADLSSSRHHLAL